MEYVKLGNIVDYRKGYAFKSSLYTDTGVMVVRVSDFTLDGISENDAVYIEEEKVYDRHLLQYGDILIQTVGSWANNPNSIVGKVVRVPKLSTKAYLNQNIVKLIPKESVDNTYLFYSLKANHFSLYCVNRGQGAANQASITLETILRFKFLVHSTKEQRRIASILSAYDNLIENNNRRIRLLEQMAENLYKEWFVRFRFPGHEKEEFENGLPKGWKRVPLKTICKFERGKNITASEMISGSVPVISAGVSPSGFHNKSNVFGASVTISSSGANAGFISIHYEDIWAADCSFVSEESTKYIYYVYEVLNNMRPVVDNLQRGAAQPHVYPKDLNRILVVVPEEHIREKANDRFYQLHQLISKLLQQNKHLSCQRDLLLPRLMSGKLEVKC